MVRAAQSAGSLPESPNVKLALGWHGVRQDVRQQLLPLAAKYSLDELQRTVAAVSRRQTARATIEYLMLAGVNDLASRRP